MSLFSNKISISENTHYAASKSQEDLLFLKNKKYSTRTLKNGTNANFTNGELRRHEKSQHKQGWNRTSIENPVFKKNINFQQNDKSPSTKLWNCMACSKILTCKAHWCPGEIGRIHRSIKYLSRNH
jgi:hypothetical protein